MRRHYEFSMVQAVLAIAIIVLGVTLLFNAAELTILYPTIFGVACLLAILCMIEGIIYNRNLQIKRRKGILYGLLALVLGVLTYVSLRVIL